MIFFQLFCHDPQFLDCAAGEFLFQEGDYGDRMYVLTSGEAEINRAGRIIETLEAGDVVGETSVVAPGPHSVSVRAVSDCQFAVIDERRFHYLVSQTPYFASEVMRVLTRRLRHHEAEPATV